MEKAISSKISGCGPDELEGWYSISLEDVSGVHSGQSNLKIIVPDIQAKFLEQQIVGHFKDQY